MVRNGKIWLSIIIPTLNEAENIHNLLCYLRKLDSQAELIVADGGSSDDTVKKVGSLARIVSAPLGRGAQMNAGARIASGEIFWFIHADCRPHPDSIPAMRSALTDTRIIGGGFRYSLDISGFRFRLSETMSNLKNRVLKLLFGDMGIFIRRELFVKIGGYKEIPLMEDMDICRRLKKMGRIVILPVVMETSARRWVEEGWAKNSIRSWLLQSAWALGASPTFLARWYRFK